MLDFVFGYIFKFAKYKSIYIYDINQYILNQASCQTNQLNFSDRTFGIFKKVKIYITNILKLDIKIINTG